MGANAADNEGRLAVTGPLWKVGKIASTRGSRGAHLKECGKEEDDSLEETGSD